MEHVAAFQRLENRFVYLRGSGEIFNGQSTRFARAAQNDARSFAHGGRLQRLGKGGMADVGVVGTHGRRPIVRAFVVGQRHGHARVQFSRVANLVCTSARARLMPPTFLMLLMRHSRTVFALPGHKASSGADATTWPLRLDRTQARIG
jgi:hypothetical protein